MQCDGDGGIGRFAGDAVLSDCELWEGCYELRVTTGYVPTGGATQVWRFHLSNYYTQLTHAMPGLHSKVQEVQRPLPVEHNDKFILSDYIPIRHCDARN